MSPPLAPIAIRLTIAATMAATAAYAPFLVKDEVQTSEILIASMSALGYMGSSFFTNIASALHLPDFGDGRKGAEMWSPSSEFSELVGRSIEKSLENSLNKRIFSKSQKRKINTLKLEISKRWMLLINTLAPQELANLSGDGIVNLFSGDVDDILATKTLGVDVWQSFLSWAVIAGNIDLDSDTVFILASDLEEDFMVQCFSLLASHDARDAGHYKTFSLMMLSRIKKISNAMLIGQEELSSGQQEAAIQMTEILARLARIESALTSSEAPVVGKIANRGERNDKAKIEAKIVMETSNSNNFLTDIPATDARPVGRQSLMRKISLFVARKKTSASSC